MPISVQDFMSMFNVIVECTSISIAHYIVQYIAVNEDFLYIFFVFDYIFEVNVYIF